MSGVRTGLVLRLLGAVLIVAGVAGHLLGRLL